MNMKTLNEQLYRIKSMMGLINEQGRIPGQIGDGKTKFENCRGIKAGSWRDRRAGNSDETEITWSKRAQKEAERYVRKEEEAELKAFNKENGLNLDKEYYTVLRDDSQKVRAYNNTKRYNNIFDESGKPFTKNMTQKIANDIESLFVDGSVWYFYWRDVFGNKTPSIIDLYNYVQNLGGKKAYINLVNSNYNVKDYRRRFYDSVEASENELKSKFPFQKPAGPTPFYIMWFEGKDRKFRYFNSYEEWNLSTQIMQEEGNRPTSGPETNGTNTVGSATFPMKPSQGSATPQLFK